MGIQVNKTVVKAILIMAAVVVLIGAALFAIHQWEDWQQSQNSTLQDSVSQDELYQAQTYYNGAWYALRDDIETMLILGVDKFESDDQTESYTNHQQADFLLLLILEDGGQSCTALQLNRDTMTQITRLALTGEEVGTYTGQLALAHTHGSGGEDSCENTVKAVSGLLYGVEIDHYMSITMDAVAVVNDLAGGVTLTVLNDMTGVNPDWTQGAQITLMGEQALLYVRSRQGLEDSTNLTRMARQRQYLLALYKQMASAAESDSDFLLNTLVEISEYMVSDCTVNQLSEMADLLGQLEEEEILELEGESVQGTEYMEFYPDEDQLQALVIQLFYTPVEA